MDDADVLTLEHCGIRLPTRLARVALSACAVAVGASAACMLSWLTPLLLGASVIVVVTLLAVLAGISTLWSP